MQAQTHSFRFSTSLFNNAESQTLTSRRNSFAAVNVLLKKLNVNGRKMLLRPVHSGMVFPTKWDWNRDGFLLSEVPKMIFHLGRIKDEKFPMRSVSEGHDSSTDVGTKRKVVEHISLLKAKEELSDEDEKNMLDFLYTTQYQMGGIIAISLAWPVLVDGKQSIKGFDTFRNREIATGAGRLSGQNLGSYTHAVFMRFQRREDLGKFYENPFYLEVLKDHVTPNCHGITYVDYESEVEDDILPIFRKGEEFNFGLEFMLLIQFSESSLGGTAEDALASLAKLATEFPSLIVQATQGSNFNLSSKEYTHGAVIRFRSSEAFKIIITSSEYKDMWKSKFQPIIEKGLSINFSVDPVGTELMIQIEVILAPHSHWFAFSRQAGRIGLDKLVGMGMGLLGEPQRVLLSLIVPTRPCYGRSFTWFKNIKTTPVLADEK